MTPESTVTTTTHDDEPGLEGNTSPVQTETARLLDAIVDALAHEPWSEERDERITQMQRRFCELASEEFGEGTEEAAERIREMEAVDDTPAFGIVSRSLATLAGIESELLAGVAFEYRDYDPEGVVVGVTLTVSLPRDGVQLPIVQGRIIMNPSEQGIVRSYAAMADEGRALIQFLTPDAPEVTDGATIFKPKERGSLLGILSSTNLVGHVEIILGDDDRAMLRAICAAHEAHPQTQWPAAAERYAKEALSPAENAAMQNRPEEMHDHGTVLQTTLPPDPRLWTEGSAEQSDGERGELSDADAGSI